MGLPGCSITEPELQEQINAATNEAEVGLLAMGLDAEESHGRRSAEGWQGVGGGDVVVPELAAYHLGVADHPVNGRQRVNSQQVRTEEAGGHDGVGFGRRLQIVESLRRPPYFSHFAIRWRDSSWLISSPASACLIPLSIL